LCAQDVCYLENLGYQVTYIQFNGQHVVPPTIANDTVQWFLGSFAATGRVPGGICTG
jgi:hypothetical protein